MVYSLDRSFATDEHDGVGGGVVDKPERVVLGEIVDISLEDLKTGLDSELDDGDTFCPINEDELNNYRTRGLTVYQCEGRFYVKRLDLRPLTGVRPVAIRRSKIVDSVVTLIGGPKDETNNASPDGA